MKVVTPVGAERIARFACRLAKARKARGKPGTVTCVTKSNVMPRSDGLFRATAERVVREVGGLEFEHMLGTERRRGTRGSRTVRCSIVAGERGHLKLI